MKTLQLELIRHTILSPSEHTNVPVKTAINQEFLVIR